MTDEQSAAAAAFARQRAAMAVEGLTCPEKAILLVLAIMGDRDGRSHPSIDTIASRASCGRRTAFRALDRLTELALIERSTTVGKWTWYMLTLDQCQSGTRAAAAPVPETTPTRVTAAPKQPENNQKRKKTTSSISARSPFPMPDGVDPQHWRDFLAARAKKRLANTASAHKRLMDDLHRHSVDGRTIPALIEHAARESWAGIYAPKIGREKRTGDGFWNAIVEAENSDRRRPPRGMGTTMAAAERFLARRSEPAPVTIDHSPGRSEP